MAIGAGGNWRLRDAAMVGVMLLLGAVIVLPACDDGGSSQQGKKTDGGYAEALVGARERSREVASAAQLKAIGMALSIYRTNHDDRLPAGGTASARFKALLESGAVTDPRVLVLERDDRQVWRSGPFTTAHFSFAMLDDESPGWRRPANRTPLVCDRLLPSGGSVWNEVWEGGVLWGDGSVSVEQDREVATQIGGQSHEADDLFKGEVQQDAVMRYD